MESQQIQCNVQYTQRPQQLYNQPQIQAYSYQYQQPLQSTSQPQPQLQSQPQFILMNQVDYQQIITNIQTLQQQVMGLHKQLQIIQKNQQIQPMFMCIYPMQLPLTQYSTIKQ